MRTACVYVREMVGKHSVMTVTVIITCPDCA